MVHTHLVDVLLLHHVCYLDSESFAWNAIKIAQTEAIQFVQAAKQEPFWDNQQRELSSEQRDNQREELQIEMYGRVGFSFTDNRIFFRSSTF